MESWAAASQRIVRSDCPVPAVTAQLPAALYGLGLQLVRARSRGARFPEECPRRGETRSRTRMGEATVVRVLRKIRTTIAPMNIF